MVWERVTSLFFGYDFPIFKSVANTLSHNHLVACLNEPAGYRSDEYRLMSIELIITRGRENVTDDGDKNTIKFANKDMIIISLKRME